MSTLKHIVVGLFSIFLILGISNIGYAQGSLLENAVYGPSLEGNLLGDTATRNLIVYLPPGYDASQDRYPVVYLLHTGGSTERFYPYNEFPPSFEATGIFTKPQDFPDHGFVGMIDSLIDVGDIQPMIIAMPNINTAYGGSFCINSALNGNYEDYIILDIVPYVDSNYRTLADRNSRAIAGHCMGGFGAMYLSMKHPDVFGLVASHSSELCMDALGRACQPLLKMENPDGITGPDPAKPYTSFVYFFAAAFSPNLSNPPYYVDIPFDDTIGIREDVLLQWAANDPIQMFPDHLTALQSLKGIYLDVGDKDELQSGYFITPFSDALTTVGIPHSFEVFDGMHFSNLYTRLSISLKYLSDSLDHTDNTVHDAGFFDYSPMDGRVQNYPNPFDHGTTIRYITQETGWVSLKIYNISGQEIETLINTHQIAGEHEIKWQPENLLGGIYFYELRTNEYSQAKKLIYQK